MRERRGRMKKRGRLKEQGIALLMVLWAMSVLIVLVLSLSRMTRVETFSTLSFKEVMEKKFAAEAGVEYAIAELFYRARRLSAGVTDTFKDGGVDSIRTEGTPYERKVGSGRCVFKVTDDSGKVDINASHEVVIKGLLINIGVEPDRADAIVDSMMDWRDADDLYRLHGAENDYYLSLDRPYKAKNADFDTVEELLLVKGMTPEVFFGTEGGKGLSEFVTVNSRNGIINLNSAPREALSAVPGISPDMADRIIALRQGRDIGSLIEVQSVFGENFALASQYVGVEGSNTFTIDSFGYKAAGKEAYPLRATVALNGNKYRFLYYKTRGASSDDGASD